MTFDVKMSQIDTRGDLIVMGNPKKGQISVRKKARGKVHEKP